MKNKILNKKLLGLVLLFIGTAIVAVGCTSLHETLQSDDSDEILNQIQDDSGSEEVEEVDNANNHVLASDYKWDEGGAVEIELSKSKFKTSNDDTVKIDDNQITITENGTYLISGESDNAQIVVDTNDEENVILILDGVSITSKNGSPILISDAEKSNYNFSRKFKKLFS